MKILVVLVNWLYWRNDLSIFNKDKGNNSCPEELSVETRDVTVVYILIAWDQ